MEPATLDAKPPGRLPAVSVPANGCAGLGQARSTSHCSTESSRHPAEPTRSDEHRPRQKFLDLPLEIRLEIYGWVHRMHLVEEAELCPWYPTPRYSAYFLAPIIPTVVWREGDNSKTYLLKRNHHPDRQKVLIENLLSPHRPIGYVPSTLLRACKQVYDECRLLPFHENEFVFVTWFSSGLSAARAFVRGLQPWQRANMRYARLEMQGRDIGDGGRLAVWDELCGYWAGGMRGLRIKIAFEEMQPVDDDDKGAVWWPLGRSAPVSWTRERFGWVSGLARMAELRSLEVELVGIEALTDAERVEWCLALEAQLKDANARTRTSRTRVSVVSVKKKVDDGAKSAETREKRKLSV